MIEHRCESIPVDEYPDIVEVRGEPIPLDSNLRGAIHDALGCASTDPTRLILNGAYLDVSKPQGHYVVATDGHHLFSSNSFRLPLKESLTIPSHRFLGWKEFNQDGDWTLRAAKPESNEPTRFEIATRQWRLIARSLEGQYPHWRAVVPDTGNAKAMVEIEPGSVEAVLQMIARMPDHDPRHHAIGLEIAGNKLSLLGKSPGSEKWTRIELPGVKVKGSDVTTHLNRQFLAKALRFGLNRIEIIDAMSPLRFSNGGRQMIAMPVRPSPTTETSTTVPASASAPSIPTPPPRAEQPEKEPMPEITTTGAPRSNTAAPTEPAEKPALETALAQIDVIRGEFRSAVAGLTRLGDLLKATNRFDKTIIFCENVDHAERMRQAMVNANPDLAAANNKYVMRITGDNDEGKAQLDNFIDPESTFPVIATTSRLMSTGVDAQTCHLIVLDRGINSPTEFKQIIGRGTRINEDYNKLFFTIMDFRRATAHFADPDFDGDPVQIYEPGPEESPIPPEDPPEGGEEQPPGGPMGGSGGEEPPGPPRTKYYVNDVEVSVATERVQYLDEHGKLITESLKDYSRKTVRQTYASLDSFLTIWNDAQKKQVILEELAAKGVFLDELADQVGRDYDAFDLVCHVAFDQPPLTRRERAEGVKKRNVFGKYGEKARSVLNALLQKYADSGIKSVESLEILKVDPLTGFGTPVEIINLFGGRAAYLAAVRELETALYQKAA